MSRILTLSIANALAALHYYLIYYVASAYLGQMLHLPDAQVGLVFSIAAGLMILGFFIVPFALARVSVRRISLILSFVDLISLLALALNPTPELAILLLVVQTAIVPIISYTLDLFLQNATNDAAQTGHMRGIFLTAGNIALVASPILIGVILDAGNNYSRIFIASAIVITSFIILLFASEQAFIDETIAHPGSILSVLRCVMRDKGLRSILATNIMLQSFYSWAGIYIPLYLHDTLHISWDALGPLFALMLLPFLLIELPMGFIEDKIRGARYIMVAGFVVMGLSFMAFSFVTAETGFAVVAVILVLTRVGAALIEITAETEFFRNVGGQDVETVDIFRMTRPLSMLVSPLIGSLFLLAMPLQSLFVPLSIICLFGIPFAFNIDDTIKGVRTRVCSVR